MVEPAPIPPDQPERLAVAFAHVLRRAGLDVDLGTVITYRRALAAVGLGAPGPVYWAGRSTLVRRPEDVAAYDSGFAAFWLGAPPDPPPAPPPVEVVVALDDSEGDDGAGGPYARALRRSLPAAVGGRGRVEAFAMGTRLTRLTRELSGHDPDAALAGAARAVPDWSGGTRLGEGLRTFNDLWGVRGLARGAIVVILSDGWDRGDPDPLGTERARLRG